MFDAAQVINCPDCGAEIKTLRDGREMALPAKAPETNPRELLAAAAPCPYCSQAQAIPEWARALRPVASQPELWRFNYRGIL